MKLKTYILALCAYVLVSVSVAIPVQAASAEKRAKIIEMMEVSGGLTVADTMMRSVSDMVIKMLSKREGKPVSPKFVSMMQDAMSDLMRKRFGAYLDRLVPIYDKTFSEEEITIMLDFYKSPTGRKMVSSLPQVLAAAQVAAQQWMQIMQPEMDAAIQGVIKKFQQENGGSLSG